VGGDNFIVFNGPDEEYLAGRTMGAEAGIGSTYSVMPELYLKMEDCIVNQKISEAATWQVRINEIIEEMRKFPSMYGIAKEILKLRGVDTGSPRLPLEAPAKGESWEIEKIHERIMEYVEIACQE
jgi:N-acetylneuraminate lyase